MHWHTAHAQHIGGRNEQQDRCGIWTHPEHGLLLAVADGMGGHQGGALAAQAVIDAAERLWHTQFALPAETLLPGICHGAQANIQQIRHEQGISPHSTCVLLRLHDQQAWWTHLGDSRLYHVRGNRLLCRTQDHSLLQMLVDLGRVREEDMPNHPDQGRLLKGLGSDDILDLEIHSATVQPGDVFLLCSDGLWGQISQADLLAKLDSALALPHLATDLVNTAAHNRGRASDNIAVALARAGISPVTPTP